jgi:hypothetical protein
VLGDQPAGAVVLGREDGKLAVALAVQPGGKGLTLVATVLGQDGGGARGLDVAFRTTTSDGAAHESAGQVCGPGCYAAVVESAARPTAATLTVKGPGAGGEPLRFALPRQWPPRPAAGLVREAERAYKGLQTLVTHERLASDATHVLTTTYRAVAPDRLRIASGDGSESIVVGSTRWYRRPGQPWQRLPQGGPVRAIAPYWSGRLEDATLLGTATVRGRPAWVVSFAAVQVPAFFTIWIDRATHRTLRLEMTAAAHFMRHDYGPFDGRLAVEPPRRAGAA